MDNGLRGRGLNLTSLGFRRAMAAHAERTAERRAKGEDAPNPAQLGAGMILETRGQVYAGLGIAEKPRRRAVGKRQRAARKIHRGNR